MKTLVLLCAGLACSLSALAAVKSDRKIRIQSFVAIENGNFDNHGAELCGVVEGRPHLYDRVTVTADYQTKGPANYTVLLNDEGRFCVVLRTVTGKARAKYWRVGDASAQEVVTAEIK